MYLPPPEGWNDFGLLSNYGWFDKEFSTETDEDGLPRWERPLQLKIFDIREDGSIDYEPNK